jgi:preprotein translocase subunit SecG
LEVYVEYGSGSGSGSGSSLTEDFFKAQAILDYLSTAMVILVIAWTKWLIVES